MKKIIVSVDTQGNPTVTTEGYVGDECVQASARLIRALGQMCSSDPKPELFQEAVRANQVRN